MAPTASNYYARAVTLLTIKTYGKAIEDYNKVLVMDSSHFDVQINRTRCFEKILNDKECNREVFLSC
jgi:hypothetical protein